MDSLQRGMWGCWNRKDLYLWHWFGSNNFFFVKTCEFHRCLSLLLHSDSWVLVSSHECLAIEDDTMLSPLCVWMSQELVPNIKPSLLLDDFPFWNVKFHYIYIFYLIYPPTITIWLSFLRSICFNLNIVLKFWKRKYYR